MPLKNFQHVAWTAFTPHSGSQSKVSSVGNQTQVSQITQAYRQILSDSFGPTFPRIFWNGPPRVGIGERSGSGVGNKRRVLKERNDQLENLSEQLTLLELGASKKSRNQEAYEGTHSEPFQNARPSSLVLIKDIEV